MEPKESNLGLRNFLQMTGAGFVASGTGVTARQALASNQPTASEVSGDISTQPSLEFAADLTTADIMVETLIAWGATHCFGVVGDGINSIIEALRKRQDRSSTSACVTRKRPPLWRRALPNTPASLASASARRDPAPSTFSTAFTTRIWTVRLSSRLRE